MKGKQSILLVDDETAFLQVAKLILEVKGYEVGTASSAREAIARMEARFYNVAILDISLPDVDGTELLSILLGMDPDLLAIMFTGYSSLKNAVESLNRGAFAYLEKPLNPENLLSVIKRGLEKQSLVFQNRRLIEELEQRNREMAILLALSQAVAQSLNTERILAAALDLVVEYVSVDAGYIYLGNNGKLILGGYKGLKRQVVEQIKQLDIDGNLLSKAFKQAQPVVMNTSDTSEPVLESLIRDGYMSHACIPLTIGGESIGVLGVATHSARSFTAREIEQLTALARELAIAIRNSQLYEGAILSAEKLQELYISRSELIASLSQKICALLERIMKFSRSVSQPDPNYSKQNASELWQNMEQEAERLQQLIAQLHEVPVLNFRILEMEKHEINPGGARN